LHAELQAPEIENIIKINKIEVL